MRYAIEDIALYKHSFPEQGILFVTAAVKRLGEFSWIIRHDFKDIDLWADSRSYLPYRTPSLYQN